MKADKKEVDRLLKTARGQIDGIMKMVDEDRYCVDISTQLLAAQSLLKTVNCKIIEAHITHCVKEALTGDHSEQRVKELMNLIAKMTK